MKKNIVSILFIILAMITQTSHAQKIISKSKGKITFIVDENLKPIDVKYYTSEEFFKKTDISKTENYRVSYNGKEIAETIIKDGTISGEPKNIIATSFENEDGLLYYGKDAFYKCIIDAYAKHQPITLSPDMIWLLICQGFSRYVNAHAEEMRPLLVNHSGKIDLTVETSDDLFSGKADWEKLMNDFSSQIEKNTKTDIAKTITADFSTTTPTERIASQVTLMESVKSYFDYTIIYIKCGIPNITIEGTPADWQRVIDKTRNLQSYKIGKWTNELEPILNEFLKASNGKPRQEFWQNIVKKKKIDELNRGGCSLTKPTMIDGWILKFFPDKDGNTLDSISASQSMPDEYVCTGFKYMVLSPNGSVLKETQMELFAGFIGAQIDRRKKLITPKIGWLARVAETETDTLRMLRKKNEDGGISIRIKEVPTVLSKFQHIKHLELEFTDKVVLPEWLDRITIDRFYIKGKMTDSEKNEIKKRFPKVIF
ncbi:MAG: DUF4419 domain-containing protein [Bacteroidaceae bacterium]|nr:DUF4419 domain-containing protein [Bacteroidaceae bacterium]